VPVPRGVARHGRAGIMGAPTAAETKGGPSASLRAGGRERPA
jgi:hypothetical protein